MKSGVQDGVVQQATFEYGDFREKVIKHEPTPSDGTWNFRAKSLNSNDFRVL